MPSAAARSSAVCTARTSGLVITRDRPDAARDAPGMLPKFLAALRGQRTGPVPERVVVLRLGVPNEQHDIFRRPLGPRHIATLFSGSGRPLTMVISLGAGALAVATGRSRRPGPVGPRLDASRAS